MRMLRLDLVSVRLTDPVGEAPVEIVRIAERRGPMPPAHEICEALSQCLKNDSRKWPPLLRKLIGEGDVSIVPLPLGLQGELGVIVAAAERTDFPRQTEALLLSVAANQASHRAAGGTAPEPSEAGRRANLINVSCNGLPNLPPPTKSSKRNLLNADW